MYKLHRHAVYFYLQFFLLDRLHARTNKHCHSFIAVVCLCSHSVLGILGIKNTCIGLSWLFNVNAGRCVCVFDFDDTLRVNSADGRKGDLPLRDGKFVIEMCQVSG